MTTKSTTLALIAGAIAATIAFPATAQAGAAPSFQTPSGNIVCWMAPNAVSCDVVGYTHSVKQLPAYCAPAGGASSARLYEGKRPYMSCNQIPPGGYQGPRTDETLEYGQTRSVGLMTCHSEPSGVTCADNSTGHYFQVSRDSYQLG
jgi:hypothetical protein